MKKLIILPLMALMAAGAFAGTDPVFSGTFSTYVGFSFDQSVDDSSRLKSGLTNDIKLDLQASIDDWNTVSVTVTLDDVLKWDDKNDDGTIDSSGNADVINTATPPVSVGGVGSALSAGNELSSESRYLRLNQFTLTSDILGALGVTGPIGLSIKFGKFGFAPASVASVAPKSTDSANGHDGTTDGFVGMQFDFKIIEKITLSTVIYPENIENAAADSTKDTGDARFEGGVVLKGMGLADMIDFAAYFVASKYDYTMSDDVDDTYLDDKGMVAGASVALSVSMLKFGLAFEYDLDAQYGPAAKQAQNVKLQFDMLAKLMEDAFKVGFSVGMESFSEVAANFKLKVAMDWQVMENFGLFAALGLGGLDDFVLGNSLSWDLGLRVNLKALALQLGWSHNLDFKAPEDDFRNVVYLKVSSSF